MSPQDVTAIAKRALCKPGAVETHFDTPFLHSATSGASHILRESVLSIYMANKTLHVYNLSTAEIQIPKNET
jgi:hypothetical protein